MVRFLAVLLLAGASVNGQTMTQSLSNQVVLVRYDFEGGWGPALVAAGIGATEWATTANRIDYVGGGGNPGGAAVARSWMSWNRDDGKYFSFEISNTSSSNFTLEELRFDISNSPPGIGPQGWALVSSGDNFNTDLAAGTLEFAFAPWRTISAPLAMTVVPMGKVEFRLLGWGANAAFPQGGHLHVDNVYLYGIPEPSSLSLLLAGGAAFAAARRRKLD